MSSIWIILYRLEFLFKVVIGSRIIKSKLRKQSIDLPFDPIISNMNVIKQTIILYKIFLHQFINCLGSIGNVWSIFTETRSQVNSHFFLGKCNTFFSKYFWNLSQRFDTVDSFNFHPLYINIWIYWDPILVNTKSHVFCIFDTFENILFNASIISF